MSLFRSFSPAPQFHIVGPDATTPGALEVINNNSDQILAWVTAQRNRVLRSPISIHKAHFTAPGFELTYRNDFGGERIEVRPYVTPPTPGKLERFNLPYATPEPSSLPLPHQDLFDKYLLVLYKGNKCAAFAMGSITDPVLSAFYEGAIPQGSYRQPVITGQFLFAGLEVIQTDVDLSGKGRTKSILCTTRFSDAVSMGAQVLPILASPSSAADKVAQSVTLYTSAGTYTYDTHIGHFQHALTPAWVGKSQPMAIDSGGTAYFGPTFQGGICSLGVALPGLDTTILHPALDQAQEAVSTYVPFYKLDILEVTDAHDKFDGTIQDSFVLSRHNSFYYYVNPGQYSDSSSHHLDSKVYIAGTVVPNTDPTLPPGKTNLNDITEFLGVSYYGVSRGNQPITLASINLAYDTVPYYDYDVPMHLYHFHQYMGGTKDDFGGTLPRMAFTQGGGVVSVMDAVTATAPPGVVKIVLKGHEGVPIGGYLYGGYTAKYTGTYGNVTPDGNPNNLYLPDGSPLRGYNIDGYILPRFPAIVYPDTPMPNPAPNGALLVSYHSFADQVALHATKIPDGFVPPPPPVSYQEGLGIESQFIQAIYAETPGGNGAPIVTQYDNGTEDSSNQRTDVNTFHTADPDHNYGYPYDYTVETSTSRPMSTNSPGNVPFLGVNSEEAYVDFSEGLSWSNVALNGVNVTSNRNGESDIQSITVYPWPPSYNGKIYYTNNTLASINSFDGNFNTTTKTRTLVTPYKSFYDSRYGYGGSGDPAAFAFTGWLHVANAKHCIQGFLVDNTPYLYLDSADFMTKLTKALKCAPTDIASLYMDIDLETIKNLVKVS